MDIWVNHLMDSARDRQRRLWTEAEIDRIVRALPPRRRGILGKIGRTLTHLVPNRRMSRREAGLRTRRPVGGYMHR
jgi:hypothetical protein